MNQEELIDRVQEEILKRLPYETVQKLADLADQDGDHSTEIATILNDNNIDTAAIAQNILNQESQDER